MISEKLKEFSGYTSIHGIGRIGDGNFMVRKLFWIFVCLASFSMAIYQITRLIGQYTSESVNTKLSTNYSALDFPSVTFCNLNPLSYKKAKKVPKFYQIVNNTAHALKLDISVFDGDEQPTTKQYHTDFIPSNDELRSAKEQFHLRMGTLREDEVYNMSAPRNEFVVKCTYQEKICTSEELQRRRDEYYGTCYTFTPETPKTKFAGPAFALDLLLNVQQDDFVPLITPSAGIRMSVHPIGTNPYLTSEGISIATQFETHVVLNQKQFLRYPGSKKDRCDVNNTYSGVLPCIEACIGRKIADICNCLTSYKYKSSNVEVMCITPSDLYCKQFIEDHTVQESNCDCKMPCRQKSYDKNIFMTNYPAENFGFVLKGIMNSTSNSLSKSMVSVKVFFSSLTEDVVEEELAYTGENFVSDIGGQLGLWAGFSVLSLAEVLELVIILFHACFSRKMTEVMDFEKD